MRHAIAGLMRLGAMAALASVVIGCAHEVGKPHIPPAPIGLLDAKRQPKFVNALPNPFDNVAAPDTTT